MGVAASQMEQCGIRSAFLQLLEQEQKSTSATRSNKIRTLKANAALVLFLQNNQIETTEQLHAKVGAMQDEYYWFGRARHHCYAASVWRLQDSRPFRRKAAARNGAELSRLHVHQGVFGQTVGVLRLRDCRRHRDGVRADAAAGRYG